MYMYDISSNTDVMHVLTGPISLVITDVIHLLTDPNSVVITQVSNRFFFTFI
jgi:hypothetical protein